MNYVQCPTCKSIYNTISPKLARERIKKNPEYYKQILKANQKYFTTECTSMDLFEFCHMCGTEYTEMGEVTETIQFPIQNVRIILKK